MDFVDFSEENELTEELRDNPLLDAAPALSIEDKAELLGLTQELADRAMSWLLKDATGPFSLEELAILSWHLRGADDVETSADDPPLSDVSFFSRDDLESTCKNLKINRDAIKWGRDTFFKHLKDEREGDKL